MQKVGHLDNVSAVRGLFSFHTRHNIFVSMLITAYFFLVSAGGIPVRLLMRKNMGERAISIMGLVTSLLFYAVISLFGVVIMYEILYLDNPFFFNYTEKSGVTFWQQLVFDILILLINPVTLFLVITLSKGAQHFKTIFFKVQKNHLQYSKHRGESICFTPNPDNKFFGLSENGLIIRMLKEPFIVLRLAVPLSIILLVTLIVTPSPNPNSLLGFIVSELLISCLFVQLIFEFSALCLFLEEFGLITNYRNAVLDIIDGEAESDLLMKVKQQLADGKKLYSEDMDLLPLEHVNRSESSHEFSVINH